MILGKRAPAAHGFRSANRGYLLPEDLLLRRGLVDREVLVLVRHGKDVQAQRNAPAGPCLHSIPTEGIQM